MAIFLSFVARWIVAVPTVALLISVLAWLHQRKQTKLAGGQLDVAERSLAEARAANTTAAAQLTLAVEQAQKAERAALAAGEREQLAHEAMKQAVRPALRVERRMHNGSQEFHLYNEGAGPAVDPQLGLLR